jgi:glycosyltransferase involved in cell wall biosynthesis
MGFSDPNPLPERQEARRALGLTGFTLLTLARLVPIKGLREALSALSDRADLEWLIAGDGPERDRLAALAREARVRVRLLGEVAGEQKRACLAAADAMLLPSRTLPSGRAEGVPTAVLEAMSAQLPVIASRTGAICELVEHGRTGLLFDPEHMPSLHHAIDLLIADTAFAEELARNASAIAARHEWRAIAPRLERMLERDGVPL